MHQAGQVDTTKNTGNDVIIEGRSEGHKDLNDNTNNSTITFAGRRPHGKGRLAAETTCVGGLGPKTPVLWRLDLIRSRVVWVKDIKH